jgi:hypothetical protein
VLPAAGKDEVEADATDTDGQNPFHPFQAPVFYVPVLMPHAGGDCKQDCTDPDVTTPPASMS